MIYALLNEIYQEEILHTLIHRVRRSLGKTGDFWNNFFKCKERHTGTEQFVYIFTEQQIYFMQKLWKYMLEYMKKKIKNAEDEHDLLMSDWQEHTMNFIDKPKNGVDVTPVYCIKYKAKTITVNFDLLRLLFIPSKRRSKLHASDGINFFHDNFNENKHDPGSPTSPNGWENYMANLLGSVRKKIEKKHSGPLEGETWLFYNGHVFHNNDDEAYFSTCINYCRNQDTPCPYC